MYVITSYMSMTVACNILLIFVKQEN